MQKKTETKAVTTKEVKVEEKTVKKAPAKKTAAKAPAKKTAETAAKIMLQFQNQEVDIAKVEEKIKAQFVAEGHRLSAVQSLEIYVKPEEYKAYYVINDGKYTGGIDLF